MHTTTSTCSNQNYRYFEARLGEQSLDSSQDSSFLELSKTELIQAIQQLASPGSPEPQDPALVTELQSLTQQLIAAYQADGLCLRDPFSDVWSRSIYLYESEVRDRLQQQVVMITGGEGCVGQKLIQKLTALGAKRVVSVDKARCSINFADRFEGSERNNQDHCPQKLVQAFETEFEQSNYPGNDENFNLKIDCQNGVAIAQYAVDLRDYAALQQVFAIERPTIVFHLAAQRLPWLAELSVRETITSNIFGTQNLIQLCEAYHVEQCVVSSTGKASRYLTAEVYAASKKVMEWQFAQAARSGRVLYSAVRFTHMLENSSVCQVYDEKIQQGRPVNIHAPHRYVLGQNLTEATHLLLNALIFAEPRQLKFVLCRNLGWPVETLEVALYKILQSGQPNFIYFQGVTAGYEESVFAGQVDLSKPVEINPLINAVESQGKTIDASGDMIVAAISDFSEPLLNQCLQDIQAVVEADLPASVVKQVLADVVRAIASSVFCQTPASLLGKITQWGKQYDPAEINEATKIHFQEIFDLLDRATSQNNDCR